MNKLKKSQLNSVLSLAAVIIISAVLFCAGFIYFSQGRNNPVILPAFLIISGLVAFGISLFFYRLVAGPMIRLWQLDEKRNLIKTRNQFADFMDDLPLGVFIKNPDSRSVYLNKYMDKIFGKSNCLGKTPYNIFDSKSAERIIKEDTRVLAGENVMTEEVLKDKNGKERVYMTHKFCMRGEKDEQLIGGISIEITLRREAEYKLRILSKAIRNSPVCVIITDPEGHIEFVNPAFVNTTGYSFAEVMGQNAKIINSGKHDKSFFKGMWTRIKSGADWQGEILNKKKDGTLFWEMVSISSVRNNEGEITHFVAIKDDISKRKQIEEELLKAKEKAEDSDKLKSAFLANMSHEIRTPMNAIVGLSSLMGDSKITSPERKNFSEIIKENSNILLQLIDDIIDISKIEAGQILIRPATCNISSLMQDIYESFHFQTGINGGKVDLLLKRMPDHGDLFTYTDPQRLRQIITNLLSNALKFTQKGSVELGYSLRKDNYIMFFVKDTGIGISGDKLEIVFDRFRQADDTGANQSGGAGLGLSISKSLTELLGGSIWVESETGKGSKFFFTIPYNKSLPSDIEVHSNPEAIFYPQLEGKSILIVEDLEVNYKLLEVMLKKTCAKIIWAKTGMEALKMLGKNKEIAMVLLDLNLPDINGYDILLEIKKRDLNMPVIIQTAYAMNGEKERCMMAGCNKYIIKPIQIDKLLAAVNSCILQEN